MSLTVLPEHHAFGHVFPMYPSMDETQYYTYSAWPAPEALVSPHSEEDELSVAPQTFQLFAAYDAQYDTSYRAGYLPTAVYPVPPVEPVALVPTSTSAHLPTLPSPQQDPAAQFGPKEKSFKCPQTGCGKAFTRRDKLRVHEKRIHPVGTFYCQQPGCGALFQQLANLKAHMLNSHAAFAAPSRLNLAAAIVATTEKAKAKRQTHKSSSSHHYCKYCPAVFKHGSSLSRHTSKNHRQKRDADKEAELQAKKAKHAAANPVPLLLTDAMDLSESHSLSRSLSAPESDEFAQFQDEFEFSTSHSPSEELAFSELL